MRGVGSTRRSVEERFVKTVGGHEFDALARREASQRCGSFVEGFDAGRDEHNDSFDEEIDVVDSSWAGRVGGVDEQYSNVSAVTVAPR
jgi:hypothetical protein